MGDDLISQDDIEKLFGQKGDDSAKRPAASASAAKAADQPLAQDDLEKLLSEAARSNSAQSPAATSASAAPSKSAVAAPSKPKSSPTASSGHRLDAIESDLATQDIELLLNQAERALQSVTSSELGELPSGISSYKLEEFKPVMHPAESATLDLIRDVELDLKIELGRTNMYLEDVLKLRKGSVVPLDKLAGDPVDIFVNGRLIARGEVLVLNDNFCVRVAELIVGANVA
jgi:flagellar motor switch protein FliN/FliY